MLSENDIKRAFLPFLRQFYKYRYEYRPETLEAELDKIGDGGLVADGMVSFRKENGEWFVCTYEATSADKAEEVKYRLNVAYFTWDCLAFGAFSAAAAYACAYIYFQPWLASLQWTGNLGFVLGMGILGFLLWFFSLRGWKKYRYIYAIEQFKRYFATEQWVALADDVFPAPNDPYLQELRSQCVYNGFGLALVPEKGDIRVLNAPSRLGIYGKDRKMVQWVTRHQWFQAITENVKTIGQQYRPARLPDNFTFWWNKVWRPVRYQLIDPVKNRLWRAYAGSVGRDNAALDRYMRGQTVQKWVFTLSLLLIAPLAYQVLTLREDDVRDVVFLTDENPEDQYGYLYEGESAKRKESQGVPKQYPDPVEKSVPTIDLSSGAKAEEDIQTIDLSSGDPEPANADPCAEFREQKGWIVADGDYASQMLAEERASDLKRKGLVCTIVPRRCLGGGSGYLVRLGPVYSGQNTAGIQADNYAKALERYGLFQAQPIVLRVH